MPENWHAATAREALDILQAAENLIRGRLMALFPGEPGRKLAESHRIPVALTITLDDSALTQMVTERQILQAHERDLNT